MLGSRAQNIIDHLAVHVREAEVSALEHVSEPFVVDAELREDRGLQVVNMHLVLDDVESEIVGLAVGEAGLGAAAGQPDREAIGVMLSLIHI